MPRFHFGRIVRYAVVLGIFLVLYRWSRSANDDIVHRTPPQFEPSYVCPRRSGIDDDTSASDDPFTERRARNGTDVRVLLVVEPKDQRTSRVLTSLLTAIKWRFSVVESRRLAVADLKLADFSLVILVESRMTSSGRLIPQLVEQCASNRIGLVTLIQPSLASSHSLPENATLIRARHTFNAGVPDRPDSVVFVLKSGVTLDGVFPVEDVTLLDHSSGWTPLLEVSTDTTTRHTLVGVLDEHQSGGDGIRRAFLGAPLDHWLLKLAFLDALHWISHRQLYFSLNRWMQIDIDDIFVAEAGTRLIPDDVLRLVDVQRELRSRIGSNFSLTLGYSGGFFGSGDSLEDQADQLLLDVSKEFVWFPHMWRHNHAHLVNVSVLEQQCALNREFAETNRFTMAAGYAIAPRHAGVWPVHDALYEAWKSIWNVVATSTEHYPHVSPWTARRGFQMHNINVLPRYSCGLSTKTRNWKTYPRGEGKLRETVLGGDVFFTLLLNPYTVWMTHQQNWAHDRLGEWVFFSLIDFARCWTRLRFHWMPPRDLANLYFDTFSPERAPLWTNWCSDQRQRDMVPPSLINCSATGTPSIVIVGPQKTGSTALSTFLSLHPNVRTNALLNDTFEEVQFFGSPRYYSKGLPWYYSVFGPIDDTSTERVHVMEKSATYFDSESAARQMASFFSPPSSVQLIVLLDDPVRRAHSWFQHELAHSRPAAIQAGNLSSLLANSIPPGLRSLRSRCLTPGYYDVHLRRWLAHFPPSSIRIVDGQRLRTHPQKVLAELAHSLALPPFPWTERIYFDARKGFHCWRDSNEKPKCLGVGKGRRYDSLDDETAALLRMHYAEHNRALRTLLISNRWPTPEWLSQVAHT